MARNGVCAPSLSKGQSSPRPAIASPNVSVFPRSYPIEQIFTRPQLIAIEVLSPEDRQSRIQARLSDFLAFGVKHVWVIDPYARKGWDCTTGVWLDHERFTVSGTPIYLTLAELFEQLDADKDEP